MAKGGKSKTDVSARLALKAQQAVCRICGVKPEVVRVLTAGGKARMLRKRDGSACSGGCQIIVK